MINKIKVAVGYVRCSTDKQDDEDGVSVIIRDQFTNEVIWAYTFPFQENE